MCTETIESPAEIRERVTAERLERLRIDAREDLSFELSAYKMGVELHGYFEIENVPAWIGRLAYEVWVSLPEDQQDQAERYLRRLANAKPQRVDCAASLPLFDAFILETLQSAEPLCDEHTQAAGVLRRACMLLSSGSRPAHFDWDDVHNAALDVMTVSAENDVIHSVAKAVWLASKRESYSPKWVWENVEDALGRGTFQEECGALRRPSESLQALSHQVFRIIKEGRALTDAARQAEWQVA